MTQQSCEQSDAHDVFFPSGFFVKQQQLQCQAPQMHQRLQHQRNHPMQLFQMFLHQKLQLLRLEFFLQVIYQFPLQLLF